MKGRKAIKKLLPSSLFFAAITVVYAQDPRPSWNDDGPGKAEGINTFIGRRPIAAFGNSDGDKQMLEWTAAGQGVRFMALVHHDDAEREWAYDRKSDIGRLDKAWATEQMKLRCRFVSPIGQLSKVRQSFEVQSQ